MPEISVIMPVYNAESFLAEAVGSVKKQSFQDWELIIVNDGSTDKSQEIIDDYTEKDKRIVSFLKKNEGPDRARTEGLAKAKGNFIFFMDADDLISSDLLQQAYNKALEENADVVIPDMEMYFGQKNAYLFSEKYRFDKAKPLSPEEAFAKTFPWQIHASNLWSASLVKKIYKPENVPFEAFNSDEYLTRLLLLNSRKIVFSKGVYHYRSHPESLTKTKVSRKVFDEVITNAYLIKLAKDYRLSEKTINAVIVDSIVKLEYLQRKFCKQRKLFSEEEQADIVHLLQESHRSLSKEKTAYSVDWKTKLKLVVFSRNYKCFERRMQRLSKWV